MKRRGLMRVAVIVVIVFIIGSACSMRRNLPLEGPVALNESEKAGEGVFMEYCQRCHPHGEAGLGPAILWAPNFAKRFQVRHGLGTMPAFGEEHISDGELKKLTDYLKAVKRNG